MLPYPLPLPPKLTKLETLTLKRAAPDDDGDIEMTEPPSKRVRTNGDGPSVTVPVSPSKKRKLDEDGILLLESKDEKLEDDAVEVIELD